MLGSTIVYELYPYGVNFGYIVHTVSVMKSSEGMCMDNEAVMR